MRHKTTCGANSLSCAGVEVKKFWLSREAPKGTLCFVRPKKAALPFLPVRVLRCMVIRKCGETEKPGQPKVVAPLNPSERQDNHHLCRILRLSEDIPAWCVSVVRKQGVNARIRFHGRLGVQFVIDFVPLLGDREKVRISHNIEWIAWFLRAHATANRSEVITICQGEQQKDCVEDPIPGYAHEMNSADIVAHFQGDRLHLATKKQRAPRRFVAGLLSAVTGSIPVEAAYCVYSARKSVEPLRFTRSNGFGPALRTASSSCAMFFTG